MASNPEHSIEIKAGVYLRRHVRDDGCISANRNCSCTRSYIYVSQMDWYTDLSENND